ncbi:hypothetical protein CN378_05015 [Bacillus sp. AFS015802]|nr:hypothetical protein CN378_05015 [Bacillus sp. AFS015802]
MKSCRQLGQYTIKVNHPQQFMYICWVLLLMHKPIFEGHGVRKNTKRPQSMTGVDGEIPEKAPVYLRLVGPFPFPI